MKKITANQIATLTGFSPATVSRALNNSPLVDIQTRRCIVETARKLGFRGVHQNVLTVAVIGEFFPQNSSGYHDQLFGFIFDEIIQRGGRVELIPFNALELLNERLFQGVINYSTHLQNIESTWYDVFSVPLVNINHPAYSCFDIGTVNFDLENAMHEAINCLWQKGHRRIVFFTNETQANEEHKTSARLHFFKEAMQMHGVYNLEPLIVFCSSDVLEVNLLKLLKQGVTALIVPNEHIGLAVEFYLRKNRIRIPEMLSLITWEYPAVSQVLFPPRSTISLDYHCAAKEAVSLLYEMMKKKESGKTITVPAVFVNRESIFDIKAHEKALVISKGATLIQKKIISALQEQTMGRRELAAYLSISPNNGNFKRSLGTLLKQKIITFENTLSIHSKNQKYRIADNVTKTLIMS